MSRPLQAPMHAHLVTPLIARDPAMLAVIRRIEQVAGSTVPVLITGESGTGKELVAAHLHRFSGRTTRPFVHLNCLGLADGLRDAEPPEAALHEAARLNLSHGGTLVLDEIGEMDPRVQAKLLQVLRQHESCLHAREETRIIAISTRGLQEEVKSGRFRTELFFRLNVVEIKLPALRDRPDDIPALAQFLLDRFAGRHGIQQLALTGAALGKLLQHSWPGNVRELENVLYRAALAETGQVITPDALEIDLEQPSAPNRSIVNTAGRTIEAVEKDMILDRLRHCAGNRARAATTLGISIRTLRNKLNDYERNGTRIPRPMVVAVG